MTDSRLPMLTGIRALHVLPQAVAFMRESAGTPFAISAAALILSGLIPVGLSLLAKLVVDHLADGQGINPALIWLIMAQLTIALLGSVLTHTADYWRIVMRDQLQQYIRSRLAAHAATLDLAFFELPGNYDTFAKAKRDLGFRPFLMAYAVVYAAQQIAGVVGFFVLVATFQPILALALFVAGIPSLLAAGKSGGEIYTTHDLTTGEGRRAAYLEEILSDDLHAKEVRLYGFAPMVLRQLELHARNILRTQWWAERRKAWRKGSADAFGVFVQYAALAFVIVQVARGQATLGDLTLMIAALIGVRQGLSQMLSNLGDLYEHSMFFQDLTRFLSERPQIVGPIVPIAVPSRIQEGLRLENVTFTYPGASQPVFDSLNLTLNAGEVTALVGINGSGKTTLVKLLTRLYDPESGYVYLDSHDIREFDPAKYRERIGVVLQDFARYQLSARENVTLGSVDEKLDSERLRQAARDAGAFSMIERLPEGWDTLLGRQFHERGQDLSGGQWQRMALARALYRNAPFLLLDEPSSALDAEAEAELFERYRTLAQNRTTLLITHRFNTVRMADRIIVLEDGRILQDGTHQVLLETGGRYAEMFNTQAAAYQ